MERKRARHKGSTGDWNNREKIISKKTYIILTDESEFKKSDNEVHPYNKEDLQQSCIFDPAFTFGSSSSDSGESSTDEWENCEDDISVLCEEKHRPTQADDRKVIEKSNSTLTDWISKKKKNCFGEETHENEINPCNKTIKTERGNESKGNKAKNKTEDIKQTAKYVLQTRNPNHYTNDSCLNKLQIYKNRIEPYYDEKLLKGNPQTLLSNISKLYLGGYSELTSLAGYVSESESSAYSEDSTKRVIKSILKRGGKGQSCDNAKKKVRFDLNLPSISDVTIETSKLPKIIKKSDEKLINEQKTIAKSTKELSFLDKYSNDTSKDQIVKNNLAVYREQCHNQNYFTNKECFPKPDYDNKLIKTLLTDTKGRESISFDSLGIKELLQESIKLQRASSKLLNKKKMKNGDNLSNSDHENTLSTKDSKSFTSIGVQSDQSETDSESVLNLTKKQSMEPFCESELKPTEVEKLHIGNQPLIIEDKYSSFIRDLVNGSGDRLAEFLIRLSSEISSKSGEEKIANALVTVGYVRENGESHELLNTLQKKTFSDNILLNEGKGDSNSGEESTTSVKKINKNGISSNKNHETNFFINNRRSMSEINIHQLKTKDPYFKSYSEKLFRSSRLDQLFIEKKNDDCICHDLPQTSPNSNSDLVGRLCEIMADLKKNVDKICKKESTIRIENAQIWLKENKNEVKKTSLDSLRKAIASEKTKETYVQTSETIGVHVSEHVQRQTLGKTEILIVSNSKNEEINIKVNDENIKNNHLIISSQPNTPNDELKEIEERKRFFKENRNVPFNVVFNEKTHLPTLKKGKYEVEIFEKMDSQLIDDTNFKNFMRKFTDNINSIKLNGLQYYDKPQNTEQQPSSSSKSNSRKNKEGRPVSRLITAFLNRLLGLRAKSPIKKPNRQVVNSKKWTGTERVSVVKSYLPDSDTESSIKQTNGELTGSNDVDTFKVEQFSCIECAREDVNVYNDEQWPDVIKTKYPNGMIHFGPLALMPEPTYSSYERLGPALENYSPPKSTACRRYIYNKQMKHMVKASMSRAKAQQSEAEMSLEEFSETGQEFYHHQWSEMGKA